MRTAAAARRRPSTTVVARANATAPQIAATTHPPVQPTSIPLTPGSVAGHRFSRRPVAAAPGPPPSAGRPNHQRPFPQTSRAEPQNHRVAVSANRHSRPPAIPPERCSDPRPLALPHACDRRLTTTDDHRRRWSIRGIHETVESGTILCSPCAAISDFCQLSSGGRKHRNAGRICPRTWWHRVTGRDRHHSPGRRPICSFGHHR